MSASLLPIFYLPPISWFSEFLKDETQIVLEKMENFPKQTYRNRAHIYGANGKLALIIPIQHNGKRLYQDTEISYSENWQALHWKSIKIAYQSSPYFEYYENSFQKLYQEKTKFLMDFNLKTIELVQVLLKTNQSFSFSEEFIQNPKMNNLRDAFSAKKENDVHQPAYYQTFFDKLGFIKDLSIIDLLCNLGPESVGYITKFGS